MTSGSGSYRTAKAGFLFHCYSRPNYVDTHGASVVGFAFAHLLGFKLLPRLKNIGSARLYRPATGEGEPWPTLAPVLSARAINWDLIAQQYDQMVKWPFALEWGAVAATSGTATAALMGGGCHLCPHQRFCRLLLA